MNMVKKFIEQARKDYERETRKTSIELMYITRAIRKGSMCDGK